eukprot:GHVL01011043.1.p1 GENE.GHVL01011043.1~~GHVL01011043.1.p1  ORF type:complete len:611 (+),score=125.22 GHVL01011043.1:62-1834(+)
MRTVCAVAFLFTLAACQDIPDRDDDPSVDFFLFGRLIFSRVGSRDELRDAVSRLRKEKVAAYRYNYLPNLEIGVVTVDSVTSLDRVRDLFSDSFLGINIEMDRTFKLEEPGIETDANGTPDVIYTEGYTCDPQNGETCPNDVEDNSNSPALAKALWNLSAVKAPKAWNIATSSDVVVAVLDSGVDIHHPDLKNNIWTNPGEIPNNGIDDDNNGYVDDVNGWNAWNNNADVSDPDGHGTHCSGTIGAVGNNGVGIVGGLWNVKVLPVRFMGDTGESSIAMALSAIEYVIQLSKQHPQIKILSNSWSGSVPMQSIQAAIEKASDLLFVAAAGNAYSDADVVSYNPAALWVPSHNIISVAAHNQRALRASFSNVGRITVDLAAPGVNILSTLPDSSYAVYSGTSMATPLVASIAAAVWGVKPSLTAAEVRRLLLHTTQKVTSWEALSCSGGIIDMEAALIAAQSESPPINTHNECDSLCDPSRQNGDYWMCTADCPCGMNQWPCFDMDQSDDCGNGLYCASLLLNKSVGKCRPTKKAQGSRIFGRPSGASVVEPTTPPPIVNEAPGGSHSVGNRPTRSGGFQGIGVTADGVIN